MKRKSKTATVVVSIDEDELSEHEVTASVTTISANGRKISQRPHTFYIPPSPERPSTKRRVDYNIDDSEDIYINHGLCDENDVAEGPETQPKTTRRNQYYVTTEHDAFLLEWLKDTDLFLDEMLRGDGLRDYDPTMCFRCPEGQENQALIRCEDCLGGELVCEACYVSMHEVSPFHCIERWNGSFFEETTLQALGLVVQLGHPPGTSCANPRAGPPDFAVVHVDGIHPTTIMYCGCDNLARAGNRVQQLLRFDLYPATVGDPWTAFTFRMLEHQHIFSLQSKLTGYDYYMSLQYLTDNTGLGHSYDRLKAFMRVVREWSHLKALKRAGRGHKPGGANGTGPGELCVKCPACPRPGFNLPEGWQDTPADMRYINTAIIAIDANFRLKRRNVSNLERDPPLAPGCGFFVDAEGYNAHCLEHAKQSDISNCTGFAALAQANTRWQKGYAATGAGMAIDGRHGFHLPTSVGDLQKGERYCNMDYIVASALSHYHGVYPTLVLSYDIVCQWCLYLLERLSQLPDNVRIELPSEDLRYAIPKYHFNAHKAKGHAQYSLYTMKVGQSDAEEPERGWSRSNPLSGSTKEMGPGSREDKIGDHMNYSNHRKYTTMDVTLNKKEERAKKSLVVHKKIYLDFRGQITIAQLKAWILDAITFDENPSTAPDPYYHETQGVTEAEIRLQLVKEDDISTEAGTAPLHGVSAAQLVVELLEIEEQQRRFKAKYSKQTQGTATQDSEVLEKRSILRRRIQAVREAQAVCMPCVPLLVAQRTQELLRSTRRTQSPDSDELIELAENMKLFLPHQLTKEQLSSCAAGLAKIEERLRDAQMHESLDKLRVQLHIKSRLVNFKTLRRACW